MSEGARAPDGQDRLRSDHGVLAPLPRVAAVGLWLLWTWLVWELLAGGRVKPEPWFWWMPYAFNVSHAVLFGLEAALLDRAVRPGLAGSSSRSAGRAPWLWAALMACAYGALLEWQQGSLPGRDPSLWDVATNTIGAFGVPWAFAVPRALLRRGVVVFLAAAGSSLAAG